MREDEVYKLLSRIRIYYQNMSKSDDVNDEWYKILKNYDTADVLEGLERYLKDEKNRTRIPMPQDLIVGLITLDKKEKLKNDYLVDCNLCHKTMFLSQYNNHYGRCLTITSLVKIYRDKGETMSYEELNTFTTERLNKFYENEKGSFKNERNKDIFRGI